MSNKKKTAIVINGAGGVGKDTLCEIASRYFSVKNISSITPIKEIATLCGWDGSKDDRSRKFLADLKALCVDYNNFPTVWAKAQYDEFLAGEDEIMFVHIREPEEIAKFVRATGGRAKTLLVTAEQRIKRGAYGNAADDCVSNYYYDFYFENDKSISEAEEHFIHLLNLIISEDDMSQKTTETV